MPTELIARKVLPGGASDGIKYSGKVLAKIGVSNADVATQELRIRDAADTSATLYVSIRVPPGDYRESPWILFYTAIHLDFGANMQGTIFVAEEYPT